VPRHSGRGVGGHAQRGLAPDQGALPEVVHRLEDVGFGGAVTDQRQQLRAGYRLRVGLEHQQRIEYGQPQEVEVIGAGLDRLAGLGARGQCGDAAGWGLGQVRPQFQQSDQPLIG
jgi:hypothetical protein